MTDGMTIEPGEAIREASDGGPLVGYLDAYTPGAQTQTVSIPAAGELSTAVTDRNPDDYPSVHLWAADGTLAVVDHASPTPDEQDGYPVRLGALPAGVHRREVVTPSADAVRTNVVRQYVVDALAEIPKEAPLRVSVDPGGLCVLQTADVAIGIAPQHHPDEAWPDTGAELDLPADDVDRGEGIRTDGGARREPQPITESNVGLWPAVAAFTGASLAWWMTMGVLSYGVVPAILTALAAIGGVLSSAALSHGVIRRA